MHAYAQTNVQLYNQLRAEGYSKEDREAVRKAYQFAMQLFTGLFLPSGKTFIDHLVGTASILASLRSPVAVVTAALLHAAYVHGDFGETHRGVSEDKRKKVRDVLGENVEVYIYRYDRFLWTEQTIQAVQDNLGNLGPADHQVLLIRLANELEHFLDLGGLYYSENETEQRGYHRYITYYAPILVGMAERLGALPLAVEIARASKNVASAQLPVVPWITSKHRSAYLVAPRSYRRPLWGTLCTNSSDGLQFCLGALYKLRRKISRVQYLLRTALHRAGKI